MSDKTKDFKPGNWRFEANWLATLIEGFVALYRKRRDEIDFVSEFIHPDCQERSPADIDEEVDSDVMQQPVFRLR